MNKSSISRLIGLTSLILATSVSYASNSETPSLKDAYAPHFTIGAALKPGQLSGPHAEIVKKDFSSISPENLLKWEKVHPQLDTYNWTEADAFVEFGEANGLEIIGHVLVWHSQTPAWVYEDADGNPLTREALLERMRDHIHTVVGRYKGRIHGWDVVNEALNEDGSLRQSKFYQIIGEDYIAKAFEYANEADPQAELFYNDFNIENPDKRKGAVEIVKKIQSQNIRITGVGVQEHVNMTWPSKELLSETIQDFADLGVTVMVTELDVDVLPSAWHTTSADISRSEELRAELNPYTSGLPEERQIALAQRYADLFEVYLKHRDVVTRVTLWGIEDSGSWLNNFPVKGRTAYPLLFNRDDEPKKAYHAVLETALQANSTIAQPVALSE